MTDLTEARAALVKSQDEFPDDATLTLDSALRSLMESHEQVTGTLRRLLDETPMGADDPQYREGAIWVEKWWRAQIEKAISSESTPAFGVDWTCVAHGNACSKSGLDVDCV